MAITSDINLHFDKEGGSSGFSYIIDDCEGDNILTFDFVPPQPTWLTKNTQQDGLIIITAEAAGESVLQDRSAQIDIKVYGKHCSYFNITQNKGSDCSCSYIQSVNITNSIPPEGGSAGFVLGTMTVNGGQCAVTFTSSTTDLHVGTAATTTSNVLDIILTQKGPNNTDPVEDTPSKSYTIKAFINNIPCGDYNVTQEGTLYCDCDHIKFKPVHDYYELPAENINGIELLSADTKGCGTIDFACESEMFENKEIIIKQEGSKYFVTANLLKPSWSTPMPRYAVVSATYNLNGQQSTDKCQVSINFKQTYEYCGCDYDFGVMTRYYDETPKYIVEPYFFDGSPFQDIQDYIPYTIPPILYNYCDEGEHGSWLSDDEYCDVDKRTVIAALYESRRDTLPDCLSFWVTVDDDCDWIEIIDEQMSFSNIKLQFARIENNTENEDRVGTILIHRSTNYDGECEVTPIKVLQRHNISSCDELMLALNGYYETFPSNYDVHESLSYETISEIYIPYGKLLLDYDEDKLILEDIYCDGGAYNANYLAAKFSLKNSVSRDEDVTTNITIKIKLPNEEICTVKEISILWHKKSAPVVRPCNCDNIHLSYYVGINIPYNFGVNCTYCSRFGNNYSTENCGTISGYTCDINGNPTEYDWFKITSYYKGAQYCGGFNSDYACDIKLLYKPTEDKEAYFRPFLIKDGEIMMYEECTDPVEVTYKKGCDYVECIDKNYQDVYKVLGLDHINGITEPLQATTDNIGETYDVGYIEIEAKSNCYTTDGIECCVRGYIDSTHTYFTELKADIKNVDGTYRIEYSFKFDNAPNQSEEIPLVIDVYISNRAVYENQKITLNYVKTQ